MENKRVFITGSAGFIGYHVAQFLLNKEYLVAGYDGLTSYYDVELKRKRHQSLSLHKNFSFTESMLEDDIALLGAIKKFNPDIIIHLAAQAGVRYSLENPKAYIDSNLIGAFNVLEAAKKVKVNHLLMASTSSVYGGNVKLPFSEKEKTDIPLTLYAATKKANESMAHSYSHLWGIPTTMLRFFTVYGPWGRPDLALFRFVDAIIDGREIEIYNNGMMHRDFTYIDDLVFAIFELMKMPPNSLTDPGDGSISPVALYRVINIGNSEKINLLEFINAIESELKIKAIRKYLPMQMGDVPATWADTTLLKSLIGEQQHTNYKVGISNFIEWFRNYYKK